MEDSPGHEATTPHLQFDSFEQTLLASSDEFSSERKRKRAGIPGLSSKQPRRLVRHASVEIPFQLANFRGWDMAKGQRISVDDSFQLAPNWNGFLHCSSVTKGNTGYLSGQVGTSYQFTNSGEVRSTLNAIEGGNELQFGFRSNPKEKGSAACSIDVYSPVSNWHRYRTALSTSWRREFATVRTQVQLTPYTKSSMISASLNSHTVHPWGIGLGWTRLRYPFLSFRISPTVRSHTANLSCRWTARSGWNWGLNLVQKRSSFRLSTGITYTHKKLNWTIRWSDQDLTISVPILLDSGRISPLFLFFETIFLSGFSQAIHSFVAQFCGTTDAPLPRSIPKKPTKSQTEALRQQNAMKSKAITRTEEEQRENGLVIRNAKYFTDKDMLDVTIPLQFWVLDSKLEMAAVSKEFFLGFRCLKRSEESAEEIHKTWEEWCRGVLTTPKPKQLGESKPQLAVRYEYQGQVYDILFHDEDEILLPSSTAVAVKET